MKTFARVLGCLCVFTPAALSAQPGEDARYFDAHVRPHLSAYAACAKQHLRQLAQKEPGDSFDRVESSLRPACGSHVDKAREALFRGGFDRIEANRVIKDAYGSLQPELRSLYEQAAASERQKREAQKGQAAAPRDTAVEKGQQELVREMEAERAKLLDEAAAAHGACLGAQTRDLALVSNESAETLAQVVAIKCAEAEKRYASLGLAFYGASRDEMQKRVKEPLDERKKRVVADIVTLRAERAKETEKAKEAEKPKDAEKTKDADKPMDADKPRDAEKPKDGPDAGAAPKPPGAN